MRKIIENSITLTSALVGLLGGAFWAYKTDFEYEPVILTVVSFLTIISHFVAKSYNNIETESTPKISSGPVQKNKQNVEVNVNIGNINGKNVIPKTSQPIDDRNIIIESKKPKTFILFIDDDPKFKTVQMFKDSGWKNTKTVKDIKSIDLLIVQNADIVFVDINGVGKLLELEHEGLDLAYMIKQKYPQKKVVIYSAKKDSNSFHKAWDIIDARIEKNALPIQFQNVAENYCLSIN